MSWDMWLLRKNKKVRDIADGVPMFVTKHWCSWQSTVVHDKVPMFVTKATSLNGGKYNKMKLGIVIDCLFQDIFIKSYKSL